ncbi:MAG TPA: DUF222 domain-containing protein [Acidimicrobiales bacterium]|nr:DUF222 domain-containing protein [Acidimicrobiales bacterium]
MKIQDRIVYGERVSALMPGLTAFGDAASIDEDGMFSSSVVLHPTVAHPLVRALMRAEAELLLEDAESIGSESPDERTSAQRRADAFMRLALKMNKASAPPGKHGAQTARSGSRNRRR